MWLVVGLGNPGSSYSSTRHNIGFDVVDALVAEAGTGRLRPALGGLVATRWVGSTPTTLFRPMTFMNRSGGPVGDLADALGVAPERVLVVHDDLDLPFGTIRCKKRGGHGGHNGLRDITRRIGRDFPRVRVGIGRPPAGVSVPDHVLGRWTPDEEMHLRQPLTQAVAAVEAIVRMGLEKAMNQFNVRASSGLEHPPSETPKTLD